MPPPDQKLQLSAKAQESLGLIPGTQFYSPFPFAGMNTQASSIAIDDKEFRYIENFFRIGDGKLRTAWDVGVPLYTAPSQIVYFYFYNIGTVLYCAVFLSDGTAVQINLATNVVTPFGAPAQFYVPSGGPPVCSQWGTRYLLIANRNTVNDYWIWEPAGHSNGAILYQPGSFAPGLIPILATGLNYTTVPTVTAYGGNGSGAVIVPTVNAGGLVELNITNPGTGYLAGDIVQLAFSGGGSDSSAILTAGIAAGGSGASIVALADGHGLWDGGASPSNVQIVSGGTGYNTASVVANYTLAGMPVQLAATTVTITAGSITSVIFPAIPIGQKPNIGTVSIIVTPGAGSAGVVAVNITAGGSGYTHATVAFSGGGGTGAAGTVLLSGGAVVGVTITNSGTGYTSAPGVAISGDGSSATGVASISASGVSGVTVVNPGSGFIYPPTITFVGGGGSAATGIVQLTGTSIAKVNVVSPGTLYQAVPTVTFNGGGGTGAAATAVLSAGQVAQINVTNAGTGYTTAPEIIITPAHLDTGTGASAFAILTPTTIASVLMSNYGTGYTSAPTVVITPGANNAAYAGIVPLMPYGISGDSMETFQSRVWIFNPAMGQFTDLAPGGNFAVSGPNSVWDFATSDGGVFFTNTDSFLQTKYTNVRQSNGYLYLFGDGSVSVVSNVQSAGNSTGTAVNTTFNYQNVDPQIGLQWRDTRQDFSRTILFANPMGAYGLYGGAVTKISGPMDDIFLNALFPPGGGIVPTGASATIFDMQHYLLLLTMLDPDTGAYRNCMVCWNEKQWTVASQSVNLVQIGTQKVGSKLNAWGTDGRTLYPLFNAPSPTLTKRLDTKHYGAQDMWCVKVFDSFYIQAQDMSAGATGVQFQTTLDVGGIEAQLVTPRQQLQSVPTEQLGGAGLLQPPSFSGTLTKYWPAYAVGTGGVPFVVAGMEITSTSPDFILGNLAMAYSRERAIQ